MVCLNKKETVAPNSTLDPFSGMLAATGSTTGGQKAPVEVLYSQGYKLVLQGNKMMMIVSINYSGTAATPEVIAKFNAGIEKWWSGDFGKYTVKTWVSVNDNGLNVFVLPTTYRDSPTEWGANKGGWEAAHEIGHRLGLPDRYDIYTPPYAPFQDYRDNIMGAPNKPPSEQDITDIIQRARYFDGKNK